MATYSLPGNRMPRILFVLINGGGNVPSQLSIARRLVQRGHDVHVLADPAVSRHATAAGCHFHQFELAPPGFSDAPDDVVRAHERQPAMAKLRRVGEDIMFGPAAAHAEDLRRAIGRLAPDALAVDCLLFGAMAGAEASGIPAATLTHFPLHGPVAGAVPGGLGLKPAAGIVGALRDRLLDVVKRRISAPGLASVNATRRSLDLAPLRDVFEQLLRLDRVLLLFPREFDFVPSGLPPHVQYVGAQLDDPLLATTATPPITKNERAPLVVLSLGSTYQAQERPFARALDALSSLPVRGIASYGLLDAPSAPQPPNVQVSQWVSHHAILPEAAAMICHGGLGSVMKAVSHAVPLVVVPLGRDQFDNAARVEACGAGIRVSRNASARVIANAVRRVLHEPAYRSAARRLAEVIARDTAADGAVREIEALAGRPRRS